MSNQVISSEKKLQKKIIAFATCFYPAVGGLETTVFEIYSRLAKKGWDIEMFVSKKHIGNQSLVPRVEIVSGIKINRFSTLVYSLMPWRMNLNLNQEGIVCFHSLEVVPHIFICLYTWFLKILGKKKFTLILTEHGFFGIKFSTNSGMKIKIKILVDRSLGVFLVNRVVDKIHAVSQWSKNTLISSGIKSDLITVIGNGVDDWALTYTDIEVSLDTKEKIVELQSYVLLLGRIDRIKNFEVTIKALEHLPKEIKLLIIGPFHDKDYYRELVDLIKVNRFQERVIFMGAVHGVNKYYLMRNAIVFVQMSISEGFGTVVAEAMSQGTICIVSSGNAMEELLVGGQKMFSLKFNDSKGLAQKIEFIYKNINTSQILEIKQSNREFAKDITWTQVTEKVEMFYREVLKCHD